MQSTKLPVRTCFVAIYALTKTKTNVAALELMRPLGVCYRSAWRLKHKIMQPMDEHEEPRQLAGCVQLDDAYLGGERNGGMAGRGSENKQAFLIAVATDEAFEHPIFAVISRCAASIPRPGGPAGSTCCSATSSAPSAHRYPSIKQDKYARRYLAETAYRFNRRFRLRERLPRLTHAMMLCAPCPERSLRSASNFLH